MDFIQHCPHISMKEILQTRWVFFFPDLNIIVLFETFGFFFITMKRLKVTAANFSINDEHIEILKII